MKIDPRARVGERRKVLCREERKNPEEGKVPLHCVCSPFYSPRETRTRILGPDRWPQWVDGTVFHLVPIHYGRRRSFPGSCLSCMGVQTGLNLLPVAPCLVRTASVR